MTIITIIRHLSPLLHATPTWNDFLQTPSPSISFHTSSLNHYSFIVNWDYVQSWYSSSNASCTFPPKIFLLSKNISIALSIFSNLPNRRCAWCNGASSKRLVRHNGALNKLARDRPILDGMRNRIFSSRGAESILELTTSLKNNKTVRSLRIRKVCQLVFCQKFIVRYSWLVISKVFEVQKPQETFLSLFQGFRIPYPQWRPYKACKVQDRPNQCQI